MAEFEYSVVQVLESPLKDISEYWCVSNSWIQSRGPNDPKVNVSFPYFNGIPVLPPVPPAVELFRFSLNSHKRWNWKTVLSVVKYRTVSYNAAHSYIMELLLNEDKCKEEKPGTPRRTSRKGAIFATMRLKNAKYLAKNNRKSTNTTAQKLKAPDADRKAHSKRSKVTEPNEIVDEVAVVSQQAFELINDCQSLTHVAPDEDQQQASVGKSNETTISHSDRTKDKPTVNEYASEAKKSLHSETTATQKIFAEFCKDEIRKLRTNEQVFTPSLITKTRNKIMSNFNTCSTLIASTSMSPPQGGPTLNEIQTQEKDDEELLLLLFIIYPLLSQPE